jgi:hypothetical protein
MCWSGVDARSGRVRVRRPVDVPGMPPLPHQQRAALALSQGRVYVAYGGLLGDCGDYRGRVVASRTDGRGPLQAFQVPTSREGGIWGASGPAVDGRGRLYVAVGNGAATDGAWDHSDSVLRLSPDLRLEDGFAPTQWPQDNAADADLGSMGPLLLAGGLVFAAGKSGLGYLLRADHLGGVGGQLAERPVCAAFGGAPRPPRSCMCPVPMGYVRSGPGPGLSCALAGRRQGRSAARRWWAATPSTAWTPPAAPCTPWTPIEARCGPAHRSARPPGLPPPPWPVGWC